MERTFRDGLRAVTPFAVAVAGFGVSFGVLAKAAGMGTLAPVVMSATTFGGSAQFAAVAILGEGGAVATAVIAAILLNARYGPMGVTVAPYLPGGPIARFLRAQLVVDESWALAAEGEGAYNPRVLLAAGLALAPAWIGGTLVGVLLGDILPDPETLGLDAAFPALFLGLLLPQLRGRPLAVKAALGGAAIALALTPLVPVGVPIVAAAAATLIGIGRRPA
jgi:4-azaleucine resistance transporter AzlC